MFWSYHEETIGDSHGSGSWCDKIELPQRLKRPATFEIKVKEDAYEKTYKSA
jgi:hypothetical protein